MTTQTLPSTRTAALGAVSTVAGALREYIADEDDYARNLLTELSANEIAAVLPAINRLHGALASIEATRKAAKR